MKMLEKAIQTWNFKKIAIWYVAVALVAGLACVGALGYIYRDRLSFAWQYAQLEKAKSDDALQAAAKGIAESSTDVVDVLVTGESGQVLFSANQSEFATKPLQLTRAGEDKKYLVSTDYPTVAFRYMKSEEFMLSSIVNKDFSKIRSDYDDDSVFDNGLSARTVYMLSRVDASYGSENAHEGVHESVYVITAPTSVSGGAMALKVSATLAALLFSVYWVLVALWLYRDASKCGLSGLGWGVIGLLTNIIGVLVYKMYKRGMTVCPSCGLAQSSQYGYCSSCGLQLGKRCDACGCKVGLKDSFCHQCGAKLP